MKKYNNHDDFQILVVDTCVSNELAILPPSLYDIQEKKWKSKFNGKCYEFMFNMGLELEHAEIPDFLIEMLTSDLVIDDEITPVKKFPNVDRSKTVMSINNRMHHPQIETFRKTK